jgi:hypothetical protein
MDVTSSRIISTSDLDSKAVVIKREKASRSTARALPAGTRLSSAAWMIREFSLRNSSLRRPEPVSRASDLRELLHTSSPRKGERWAGEKRFGFISKRVTTIPRLAACQAASHPANPPPIISSRLFCIFNF